MRVGSLFSFAVVCIEFLEHGNFFPSVVCVYLVMFVTHDLPLLYSVYNILGDMPFVDQHAIYTANGNLVELGIYNLLLDFGRWYFPMFFVLHV